MDKKRNMGTYLLASVMPGVLLLSVYIALGVYPFGQRSLLITDMSQLYVDFYSYLIDVFHGQKALFFSWEGGLGMNMTGVVSFYLAARFRSSLLFLTSVRHGRDSPHYNTEDCRLRADIFYLHSKSASSLRGAEPVLFHSIQPNVLCDCLRPQYYVAGRRDFSSSRTFRASPVAG